MLPIVHIQWLDANYQEGEVDIETLDQRMPLDYVGLLIKETDYAVTVALEEPHQGRTRNPFSIPKINILHMEVVPFEKIFGRRTRTRSRKKNTAPAEVIIQASE